jgi:hypothetical protein
MSVLNQNDHLFEEITIIHAVQIDHSKKQVFVYQCINESINVF